MGALSHIRVLDLTRVLAGPWCTQTLADLGADVIKIERPGQGDDTRQWGPPYARDAHGQDTTEAAYYLAVNRNKRSVTLDIATAEGQDLVRRLASPCPACQRPGFDRVRRIPGRPCSDCGAPTELALSWVYGCQGCGLQETRQAPGDPWADPGSCPSCNP